jgi:hypothetical protein
VLDSFNGALRCVSVDTSTTAVDKKVRFSFTSGALNPPYYSSSVIGTGFEEPQALAGTTTHSNVPSLGLVILDNGWPVVSYKAADGYIKLAYASTPTPFRTEDWTIVNVSPDTNGYFAKVGMVGGNPVFMYVDPAISHEVRYVQLTRTTTLSWLAN